MAQIKYRGNLSTAEYPLNPRHMGASVIVAGYDQNLSRYTDSPESRDLSIGIPQIYAAENVLPTKEGIASVVYQLVRNGDPLTQYGRHPATVYAADGTALPVALLTDLVPGGSLPKLATQTPGGAVNYTALSSTARPGGPVLGTQLSGAYVQGVSYLYIPASSGADHVGLYVFNGNPAAPAYEPATLAGLDATEVRGILGVNGYLLAYTDKAVAWSSTLQLMPDRVVRDTAYAVGELVRSPDLAAVSGLQYKCTVAGTTAATAPAYPTAAGGTVVDGTATFVAEALSVDFVPSLETGAGGGLLEDARGEIITARPGPSGFMVYTAQNIVAATYTANAEYPYQFRSLPNSAGIQHASCVTPAAELGWHYALTTSGLMQVAAMGCKLVFPAVTHWLNSTQQVRFPAAVAGGALVNYTSLVNARLAFVQNRYLCISKGISTSEMSVALVYDTALDRWGQLYFDHNYIIDRTTPEASGDVRQDLPIIVRADGTTYTWRAYSALIDHIITQPANVNSWVLLGRYRHSRSQNICLQELDISSCYRTEIDASQVYAYVTREYSAVQVLEGPLYRDSRANSMYGRQKYLTRTEGTDISLLIVAPFELSSIELTFTTGGHR